MPKPYTVPKAPIVNGRFIVLNRAENRIVTFKKKRSNAVRLAKQLNKAMV